jgi:hypothetical protein
MWLSWHVAGAPLVLQITVLLGIAPPVLVAQLILPWYLSDAARERLAASFSAAAKLLRAGYQVDQDGRGGVPEDIRLPHELGPTKLKSYVLLTSRMSCRNHTPRPLDASNVGAAPL